MLVVNCTIHKHDNIQRNTEQEYHLHHCINKVQKHRNKYTGKLSNARHPADNVCGLISSQPSDETTSQRHHVSYSTSLSRRMAAAVHCLSISGKLMRRGGREGTGGSRPPFKMHYPRDRPPAGHCLTDRESASG